MSVGVNEQQEEEEEGGMHCSLFVFMEKIDFSYSIDTTLVFVGPPWNARNTLVSRNVGALLKVGLCVQCSALVGLR